MRIPSLLTILVGVSALLPALNGQSVTGQITGTVADSSGGAVVGATVRLTSDLSQQTRSFTTESNGTFTFTNLVPGNYSVHISMAGFKAYDEPAVNVSAQERVDLHEIRLQVGEVTSTVTVQAEAAHVATDSSDRAVAVNLQQIVDTPIRGRDFQAIIKDLPGVQDINNHDTRGWGANTPTINGGAAGQTLMTLDGVASQDSGAPSMNAYLAPSVDSIAEVKLLTSNYTAEYGARNGGQVTVTTKNGTREFHGSAYYYWRHEELDANEWFNNRTGVARPRYRYQNPGVTIGGPLVVPGTRFNQSRTKLFFFFSYDYLRNIAAVGPNRYTMPTAGERTGDFSATVTSAGQPILIRDPLTGLSCSSTSAAGCFPGNKVPASRFSSIGSAYLKFFPLPNTTDPTGQRQYNFQTVLSQQNPREDKILRIDYNLSSKTQMFVRLQNDYQNQSGYGAILGAAGDGWGQYPHSYHIPSAGAVATIIHTFRPNLVNEFSWGINRAHQGNSPVDPPNGLPAYSSSLLPLKDANGNSLSLPHVFSGNNYLNLLPNINFGFPTGFSAQSGGLTVPNTPGFGFDSRWPFDGTDQVQNVTDTVTALKGSHTIKAGFYAEIMARNVNVYSQYNTAGTFYFGSDTGNGVDSGFAFSNLLLGSVFAYGEDNKKQINHARYKQYEWFLQDTWRASRRLTFDAGMRFQFLGALYSQGANLGLFSQSAYNPAQTGQLLLPALAGGQKASINPATGKVYSFVQQGTFDPASYSNLPFSGIVPYNSHFWNNPSLALGPRVGFAWDVFGNGKTALRGGFGIFYGRAFGVDNIGANGPGTGPIAAPPNFVAPLFLYSTITNLQGAQPYFTPQNVYGGPQDYPPPATYDWSIGIQRDLGHRLILDVAYVANVAHHQGGTANDFNAVRPFTTLTPTGCAAPVNLGCPNPAYYDPTSSNGGTGGFYSTNLIRALSGGYRLGSITTFTSIGESYYDSLQVQLNRRFSSSLQFGINYTWSKTINYSHNQWVPDYLTKNVTSNRPHAVNLNFGYNLPAVSKYWSNPFTKEVLDGWHLAGIGTLYYGTAMTIGCSANSPPIGYWTGTPTGGIPFRCQMNGSLWLPDGATPSSAGSTTDPRLWYPFAASNFTLPGPASSGVGNTPPALTYGPGVMSFDLSLAKDVRLGSERRVLQFKIETFNTFNHFNPSNPNTSLSFNFSTACVTGGACTNTNANFGAITSAQVQARHAQASVRFRF